MSECEAVGGIIELAKIALGIGSALVLLWMAFRFLRWTQQ